MYLEYFKLRHWPFALTPDTHFFFNVPHVNEAMDTILHGLRLGEGLLKVTGEVGLGKTLLCRKLVNDLQADYAVVFLPNPVLTPGDLTKAIADELGVAFDFQQGYHAFLKVLLRQLIDMSGQSKRVVILVDEVQAMPDETLEALRLLSNLETERQKVLQIVLFAQPELDERLSQERFRSLRQRVGFSAHLSPLSPEQTRVYVEHRMLVAGCPVPQVFEKKALRVIHDASRGTPRLVNILCHKSLMVAFGRGAARVVGAHAHAAVADSVDLLGRVPPQSWWRRISGR
ncbi:MAG: AAA family ATPase [Magnetococcus sp. WYHC-3]